MKLHIKITALAAVGAAAFIGGTMATWYAEHKFKEETGKHGWWFISHCAAADYMGVPHDAFPGHESTAPHECDESIVVVR